MKYIDKYSYLLNNKINKNLLGNTEDAVSVREHRLWYLGDINRLLAFYKQGEGFNKYNQSGMYTPNFFKLAPVGHAYDIGGAIQANNFTVYHNSIPSVISRAMSNLIFAKEPIFNIPLANEKLKDLLEARLDTVLINNKIGTLLQTAAETESYSGAIAFKPVIDKDFSELPILQLYAKDEIIVNKKYGKVISIVFIDPFKDKKGNTNYLLSEYGKGFILYKVLTSGNKLVDPKDTDEYKDLENLEFNDSKGNRVDVLLAVYKENKPFAISDYYNTVDDFMAVDEVYSNLMNFIRKTSPKRIVSSSTFKTFVDGNPIVPSVYDSDLIVNWDSSPSLDNKTINELQTSPELASAVSAYREAMKEILTGISRDVGLSLKTLLNESSAGANSSAEALIVRDEVDLKTAELKAIGWKEALEQLYKVLLILETATFKGEVLEIDPLDDIKILVELYNPAKPTFSQVVQEVKDLLDAGLIDELGALERLWVEHGYKTKEEVLEIYQLIKGNTTKPSDFLLSRINEITNTATTNEEGE